MDKDQKECFLAMMSVRDTGRGPLIVLGYPFLRNYATVFDFDKKELGFADAKEVGKGAKVVAAKKDAKKKRGVAQLKGIRPS